MGSPGLCEQKGDLADRGAFIPKVRGRDPVKASTGSLLGGGGLSENPYEWGGAFSPGFDTSLFHFFAKKKGSPPLRKGRGPSHKIAAFGGRHLQKERAYRNLRLSRKVSRRRPRDQLISLIQKGGGVERSIPKPFSRGRQTFFRKGTRPLRKPNQSRRTPFKWTAGRGRGSSAGEETFSDQRTRWPLKRR